MSDADGVYIDGEHHTMQTLSYREQREMRDKVKELLPDGNFEDAGEMDIIPALVYVVRRRTDPEFTIEQALDIKPVELAAPEDKPSPPRKRRASSTK